MFWPTFRQNQWNNPSNVVIAQKLDPGSIAKVRLGGIIWGTPVVDRKGDVYIGSTNKRFFCIDGKTWEKKWVFKIDNKADSLIDSAGALIMGGGGTGMGWSGMGGSGSGGSGMGSGISMAVIPGGDGCIHAVRMDTGDLVWKKCNSEDVSEAEHEKGVKVNSFEGNVQVDDEGNIYAGCDNEYMYCMDKDGRVKWKFRTGMMIWTCAVVAGDYCFFGSLDFYLYCVDRRTGRLIFKHNTGAEVKSSPLFHDGRLYVGNTNGDVICFNGKGVVWKADIDSIYASPVVYRGSRDGIIFATFNGNIVKLDLISGEKIWGRETHSNICCSPIVVNGVVYVGNNKGMLFAMNGDTGDFIGVLRLSAERHKNTINASLACLPSGHLVVGCYDGYAYRVPWNFFEKYGKADFAAVTGIAEMRTHVRTVTDGGHIITLELVVPTQRNACISYSSLVITPNIPFDAYLSADGKFINLVPKDWSYLGTSYNVAVSGRYYLQTESWLSDRFVKTEYVFSDIVKFTTAAVTAEGGLDGLSGLRGLCEKTLKLSQFYIQQPSIMDTYIPAAMDAQGFKVIIEGDGGAGRFLTMKMIPCIPDEEDDFQELRKSTPFTLTGERFGNIIKATGGFNISAMGGTIMAKKMVAFITIGSEGRLEGQLFIITSPLHIKGNGSSYRFSSEIINQICDPLFYIYVVGEFKGVIAH